MTSGSIDSTGSSSKYQKQFLYLKYMTLYNCFAHSDSSLILFIFSLPSCPCVTAVFTLCVYLFFHSFHYLFMSLFPHFCFCFFFYGFKSVLHLSSVNYSSLTCSFFNFLFQMCSSISAHCSTPQQLVIPDGGDGGSAQGSYAEEQQRSAQAVTPTH